MGSIEDIFDYGFGSVKGLTNQAFKFFQDIADFGFGSINDILK